jgi:hypothetical protein
MKTRLRGVLLPAFIVCLVGCVTVAQAPKRETKSATESASEKREVSQPVPFKVDPRYAEWHTNRASLQEATRRARNNGDFIAANALSFKAKYAEHFYNHFERRSPTGSTTKLVEEERKQLETAKHRREVQRQFKNAEAVKEIDAEISRREKFIEGLKKEDPEQRLAAIFVIQSALEETLAGIVFLIAYNEFTVPLKADAHYLKVLRECRVRLANGVARGDVPPEVAKRGLKLGETLVKIEERFLSGAPSEARMLAHKVATEILDQN